MTAANNSLDRFSLRVDGKIDQGVRMTIALDLNTLAEELVDRLHEQDLIDFVMGLVEAFDDLDTTQDIQRRVTELREKQEQDALEAERLMDLHG